VRTVDEHDHVGVLFDGAGFAQVGELRAALFAFGSARELAEDQDGNCNSLGQTLRAREILETSSWRLPKRPRPVIN